MGAQETHQLPPPHLNQKDLEVIKGFCKEHIDQHVIALLENGPEYLAKQGMQIVPIDNWKTQMKRLGFTFGAAFVGTAAAMMTVNYIRRRRENKVNVEMEKEFNGASKRGSAPRLSQVA